MKLYKVTAKCGHVGRNFFVIKDFPIKASNGKEAAKIARNIPRVKHHHKDAILNVNEISVEEYERLIVENNNDPYFHCVNVQEQRQYEEVIYSEQCVEHATNEVKGKTIYFGKELLRNPKKYMNSYYTERYAVWG